jgi:hypothetical protein
MSGSWRQRAEIAAAPLKKSTHAAPTALLSSALSNQAPIAKLQSMNVQAATKSDIPAIMLVERTDGYGSIFNPARRKVSPRP